MLAASKQFFEIIKEVGKKVHIHFSENIISDKTLSLHTILFHDADRTKNYLSQRSARQGRPWRGASEASVACAKRFYREWPTSKRPLM